MSFLSPRILSNKVDYHLCRMDRRDCVAVQQPDDFRYGVTVGAYVADIGNAVLAAGKSDTVCSADSDPVYLSVHLIVTVLIIHNAYPSPAYLSYYIFQL